MRICRPPVPAKTGPARSAAPVIIRSAWGTQALADIAEREWLVEQLSQSYPGASMDDVDLDAPPVSSATRPPSTPGRAG